MTKTRVPWKEIFGRRIELPDARYVFVGKTERFPDEPGIIFANGMNVTSFRLSNEAKEALIKLLLDETAGISGNPPPVATGLSWAETKEELE